MIDVFLFCFQVCLFLYYIVHLINGNFLVGLQRRNLG